MGGVLASHGGVPESETQHQVKYKHGDAHLQSQYPGGEEGGHQKFKVILVYAPRSRPV